jgi:hypothetical protein
MAAPLLATAMPLSPVMPCFMRASTTFFASPLSCPALRPCIMAGTSPAVLARRVYLSIVMPALVAGIHVLAVTPHLRTA